MAVDRVERLLRRTSEALNTSGVDYAIIGGNAVAAWVSTVDEGAVRTTKDVDVLIRRSQLDRTAEALRRHGLIVPEALDVDESPCAVQQQTRAAGFSLRGAAGSLLSPDDTRSVVFREATDPDSKTGVRVVFAGEKVRPHHAHPAPDPSDAVETPKGFRLIELPALVAMKLQSYRFIDRAHIQDLIAVGLIDNSVRDTLPNDLRKRLNSVEEEGAGDRA